MNTDLLSKLKEKAPNQKPKRAKKQDFLTAVRGKQCFSFDFGEYSTKLTVAKVSGQNVQVIKQILIENREHSRTIEEDNLNEWRSKISKALTANHLNPVGQIGVCAVNSRHYIARQFELPQIDDADLAGMASHELSQSLELDMEEHVFQHKVLRTYERNGRNMCTVWAAAVPKSLCRNYFNLLSSLKLKPMLLDVHVNGLESILAADSDLASKSKHNSVAMIDYGLRNTEMYIFSKGNCVQSSNIDSGEGRLIAAAKNALGGHIVDIHNQNKITVPPQQIYEIIKDADTSETAAVFADVVQKWISEINNVIRRFNIDHPGEQIERVFLYGGSQQLPWLKAYLEKLISIPVEIISGTSCIRSGGSSEEFPKFLNSAAILLRNNRAADCNFFEGLSNTRQAAEKIPPAKIALFFGVILLACGLFYGFHAFRSFMLKDQKAYLNKLSEDEALNKKYMAALKLSGTLSDLEKDKEFMTRLTANTGLSNTANLALLKLIDECIEEDAVLRNINIEKDRIDLRLETKGAGSLEDVQQITAIENRFRNTGYFSNVLVDSIKETLIEKETEDDDPRNNRNPRQEDGEEEEKQGLLEFSIKLVLGGGAINEE